MPSIRSSAWAASAAMGLLAAAGPVLAAPVSVANYSFESPQVPPAQIASPLVQDWNTPGPTLTEVFPGVFVNANCVIFPNTPAGNPDSIDNVDGNQVAAIGTQSGNEFNQTLAATFAANTKYALTAGVARSLTRVPAATDRLRLVLFYLDAASQRQEVAAADIFNDAAAGISATHLKDFAANSITLAAGSPAVGKPIGVLITTAGATGGFFDFDNVRVTAVPEPATAGALALGAGLLTASRRRRATLSK